MCAHLQMERELVWINAAVPVRWGDGLVPRGAHQGRLEMQAYMRHGKRKVALLPALLPAPHLLQPLLNPCWRLGVAVCSRSAPTTLPRPAVSAPISMFRKLRLYCTPNADRHQPLWPLLPHPAAAAQDEGHGEAAVRYPAAMLLGLPPLGLPSYCPPSCLLAFLPGTASLLLIQP